MRVLILSIFFFFGLIDVSSRYALSVSSFSVSLNSISPFTGDIVEFHPKLVDEPEPQ